MEIGIKVMAEDVRKRTQRHVMSSFFTMVAVDEQGVPTTVPPLVLTTDNERGRFNAAKDRKKLREEFEAAHNTTRVPEDTW